MRAAIAPARGERGLTSRGWYQQCNGLPLENRVATPGESDPALCASWRQMATIVPPSYRKTGTQSGGIRICGQPQYDDRTAGRAWAGRPLHRRVLLEEGRCMILLLIMALHSSRDPTDCAT